MAHHLLLAVPRRTDALRLGGREPQLLLAHRERVVEARRRRLVRQVGDARLDAQVERVGVGDADLVADLAAAREARRRAVGAARRERVAGDVPQHGDPRDVAARLVDDLDAVDLEDRAVPARRALVREAGVEVVVALLADGVGEAALDLAVVALGGAVVDERAQLGRQQARGEERVVHRRVERRDAEAVPRARAADRREADGGVVDVGRPRRRDEHLGVVVADLVVRRQAARRAVLEAARVVLDRERRRVDAVLLLAERRLGAAGAARAVAVAVLLAARLAERDRVLVELALHQVVVAAREVRLAHEGARRLVLREVGGHVAGGAARRVARRRAAPHLLVHAADQARVVGAPQPARRPRRVVAVVDVAAEPRPPPARAGGVRPLDVRRVDVAAARIVVALLAEEVGVALVVAERQDRRGARVEVLGEHDGVVDGGGDGGRRVAEDPRPDLLLRAREVVVGAVLRRAERLVEEAEARGDVVVAQRAHLPQQHRRDKVGVPRLVEKVARAVEDRQVVDVVVAPLLVLLDARHRVLHRVRRVPRPRPLALRLSDHERVAGPVGVLLLARRDVVVERRVAVLLLEAERLVVRHLLGADVVAHERRVVQAVHLHRVAELAHRHRRAQPLDLHLLARVDAAAAGRRVELGVLPRLRQRLERDATRVAAVARVRAVGGEVALAVVDAGVVRRHRPLVALRRAQPGERVEDDAVDDGGARVGGRWRRRRRAPRRRRRRRRRTSRTTRWRRRPRRRPRRRRRRRPSRRPSGGGRSTTCCTRRRCRSTG